MNGLTISDALGVDPNTLAEIRVEAMRPSLQAVGRFDPDRARQRFLTRFDPKDTKVLRVDGQLIGFYVLRLRADHLYLDHLYVRPQHQGAGIGRDIVQSVQSEARDLGLPVRLTALRDSPANRFYQSCGFVLQEADALDNHYVWHPVP